MSVPDEEGLKGLADELHIKGSFKELCENQKIRTALIKKLNEHGRTHGLQSFENVKNIYLETEPFTPENGLLSPTFKFKVFIC
jgi:long-chain acyl-CoA synthetase